MSRKTQVRPDPENTKGINSRVKAYKESGLKVSFNGVANEVMRAGLEALSDPKQTTDKNQN